MARNQSIDIAKGICLLLMVIGHFYGLPRVVFYGIESFHMPFFFLAGGIFFKEKSIDLVCKTGMKRLIVPLLIGVSICALVCLCFGNEHGALYYIKALLYPGGTRSKDIISPHWPEIGVFWFLAALFWTRIMYAFLYKICQKHILWVCALLSWFFIILARRLMLPLGFSEGMSGLVFYAVGHYAASHNLHESKLPWCTYIFFIFTWILDICFIPFQMFQCNYVWYLYPIGVCFACGMGKIVYEIAKVLKARKVISLSIVGFYSLEIMCCHQVVRTIASNSQPWNNDTYNFILIGGTICLSVIYILLKKIVTKQLCHE